MKVSKETKKEELKMDSININFSERLIKLMPFRAIL